MGAQKLLNIMAVDDEPDILFVTKKLLEREGYNIVEASSGEECIKKIKENRPDVILLDVKLPDIDGWEICRMIKEDEKTRSISVVMFTGRSTREDIDRSFDYAGAEWHLSRPFKNENLIDILRCVDKNPDEILSKIDRVVEKERHRKEVLKMLNPKIMNYKYEF